MANLFTYGTLRRGERNHPVLKNRNVVFIREDFIYADRCGFWGDIPLIREGGGTVLGEVYEVPDDQLVNLDHFEGTAYGLYYRRQATTHSGIEAWIYFPGEELLNQG